jgi:hypothetical protein
MSRHIVMLSTHVCMCMYVCMHVCMYVSMYVCKYVCKYVCMHVCMCVLLRTQTRKNQKSDLLRIIHPIRILWCHCTREAQIQAPKFLLQCSWYMCVCIYESQTTAEDTNTQKSEVRSLQNNTHNTHTTMPLCTKSTNTGTKVPLSVPSIHVCLYMWVSDYCWARKHKKNQKSDLVKIIHTIHILQCHCAREAQIQAPKYLFQCPQYMRVCICGGQTTAKHANTQTLKVRSLQNNTHNTHTTMPLCTRSTNTAS